jgi:RHS repeat-associated protein
VEVSAVVPLFGSVRRSPRRGPLVRVVTAGVVLSLMAAGLVGPASARIPGVSSQPMVPVASDSCGSGSSPGSPVGAPDASVVAATVPDHQEVVSPGEAQPHVVAFDSARVVVPPGAVKAAVSVGISDLIGDEVPKLDAGMTNVTGTPRGGFRFTPHPMRFASNVELTLPYDPKLVPSGTSAQDVYTYFYDDVALCWKPLQRTSVDEKHHTVTSLTNHFTDFVNTTVTAPDSPDNVSFNPNQIKGITAGDPGAGVTMMSAPAPNNQGTNNLSYPVDVPAGRAGLQPSLAISYDSAAGNGWLGVGWGLSMPSIVVDTRWGVPRYDSGKETETYRLNGAELTPVAHRGPAVTRSSGDKVFHTRVEGAFARIVRHGTGPKSYTWDVTDKTGTVYTYGTDDAALKDDSGNIFQWFLLKVTDLHGNFVRYHYARQDDAGVGDTTNPLMGRNLYPSFITWTGSGTTEGRYSVVFTRDRQITGWQPRADKTIDARGGFKLVTADLLRTIEVKFNDTLVRRYELEYTTGAFDKTLLARIKQFDAAGVQVGAATEFSYFDQVRDGSAYQGFSPAAWTVPGDDLGNGVLNLTGQHAGEASVLGASSSASNGGHFYVGSSDLAHKGQSIGVSTGFDHTSNDGVLALVDVDGDNLPDKVFRKDGAVYYRKNLAKPGGPMAFSDAAVKLDTLGDSFSSEHSDSMTFGVDKFFESGSAQLDFVNTFATTDRYFLDVNDDGITDLVDGTSVLFGRIGAGGVPVYGVAGDTPAPITQGSVDTGKLFGDFGTDQTRFDQSSPLVDTVIRWVAPFTGTVRVTGSAQLDPATLQDRLASRTADGVKISIATDTSTLVTDVLGKTETGVHFEDSSPFGIIRGQAVYIRVSSDSGLSSLADGGLDAVLWNDLQVAYTDGPGPDVNNLSQAVYKFSDDFTLAGRTTQTPAPLTGIMHFDGDFTLSGPVSDDVTVQITRDGTPVLTKTIPSGSTDTLPVNVDLDVTAGQKLSWNVKTDSPIDIHKASWTPRAFYTAADGIDPNQINDAAGDPRIVLNPTVNIDMYPANNLATAQAPWTEPALTGGGGKFNDIVITPAVGFSGGAHPSGQIVFTVKQQPGKLIGKETFTIADGEVKSSTGPISFRSTTPGEQYYLDFSARDLGLFLGFDGNVGITVNGVQNTSGVVFDQHSPLPEGAFQQPYRGWQTFGYNPAAGPLTSANLVIDDSYDDTLPTDVDPATQLDAFKANPTITPPRKVVPFYPQPKDGRWGAGPNSWVAASGMSSSRLGAPSLSVPTTAGMNGAVAVPRISRSDTFSATGQVLPEGGSLGGSAGIGSSSSLLDYLDLNGDGFPDVIGNGGIQYTDPTGKLSTGDFGTDTAGGTLPDGAARSSTDKSGNANAGSAARTIQTGLAKSDPDGRSAARTAKAGGSLPPLGVGDTLSGSTSNTNFDLVDINGDGLPDRVYDNGEVALNLGYRFGQAESWQGAGTINDGTGLGAGLKLGFNTDFYGLAGGGSFEHNLTRTKATLADINGDGLVDRVFPGEDDSHPIKVSFNTGNGFATPVDFGGAFSEVAADRNANIGENGFFEFPVPCQPIPTVPGCWIVFNASAGATHTDGVGRTELALRDLNGDGFVDDLASTKDDSMSVLLNTTGKTNLLKGVTLPLGAADTRATMAFDYSRDGDTYQMPQSRFVLSQVNVDDKRPGDGQDVRLSTFEYSGGVYDRAERQFRGYAQVVTRQRDAGNDNKVLRSTTAQYRTDSYYTAGLPTSTVLTDADGHKFTETENTYSVRNVDSPDGPVDLSSQTSTLFPFVQRVDTRSFEGQATAGKTTFSTMDYDAVGNLIDSLDTGEPGSGDDVDTRMSYTATDPNCRATGLTGAADTIDVFGGGTLMRHRESTVDCNTGNVTQVRARLANGDVAATDMTYLTNGNLHTLAGPANNTGQHLLQTYGYDPDVDTRVASVVDSFGLTSSTTYDPKFGTVLTTTDENNQKVTNTYDNVGRLVTVTSPYEQGSSNATIRFEYHPEAATPYAITQHFDRQLFFTVTDTIDTITFVDGLGRVIQTKADATVTTGPNTGRETDMIVSGRVDLDALGRAVRKFYPITEPKAGDTTTLNPAFTADQFDSVQPTVTSYDVLDRPTKVTLPDGTSTTMSYGFGTDRAGGQQFETITTDANGHPTRSYTNVRGQTTALKQFNPSGGQAVIWTSYGYDPLGQRTSITDDKNNVTTMAYDNLGRQTTLTSSDSGRTDYTYDLAGNLTTKHVAKLAANQFITYDYDFTRLKAIHYPIFTANNVTYTYGGPSAANNAAGRITHISDAAGSVDRTYGPLGEVTSETRTTTGPANKQVSFTTSYQFDAFNRLLSLTYPDGEVLRYGYDSGGRVILARGDKEGARYLYLQDASYDKFGQLVQLTLGNGVKSQYSYDSQNRRLTNLKSNLAANVANGYVFQNLSYTYDNVGNVTSIANDTAPPSPAAGAQVGGASTQTFSYDDLDRLTHAQGSYTPAGKVDTYTQNLTYDSISNITNKTQNHTILSNAQSAVDTKLTYNNTYTYNTAGKPHAASVVGAFTFQYDGDGNQISRAQQPGPRQQLIWDEENRLACDHENDSTNTLPQNPSSCDKAQTPDATFRYDDQGNRIVKQGAQLHLYPNQFYSTVDKFEYKHIYMGTAHLATKLRNDGKVEDQAFYTHSDNIGSTSFITTGGTFFSGFPQFDGQLAQHTDYIPGGETWVNEDPVQPIPQQYTGKELDPETGLYYYGARYYNPTFQAFQSTDPDLPSSASDTTSLSTYLYARGNPVRYNDPDGRAPEDEGSDPDREAPSLRAPNAYHPTEAHNHTPSGKWAQVRADAAKRGFEDLHCAREEDSRDVVDYALTRAKKDYPLATAHLQNYLTGHGMTMIEDATLKQMLELDHGVADVLMHSITRAQQTGATTGYTWLDQGNYAILDYMNSFGAIDRLDWRLDAESGTVYVWFQDRYEWHPVYPGLYTSFNDDTRRDTNCFHAAMVEEKAYGAQDFWMIGDASTTLDALRTSASQWDHKRRKVP